MNVKYVVLLMLWNESEVKVRYGMQKLTLWPLVRLILWAKHAGLFEASFCWGFIFN